MKICILTLPVLVFFIGYIIFDLPSNMLIKKVGAANWLSGIAFSWGAVSIGIGFCNSWIAFSVCRVLLGMLEAVRLASLSQSKSDFGRDFFQAAYTWFRGGTADTKFKNVLEASICLLRHSLLLPIS
jgi:MFS family permease